MAEYRLDTQTVEGEANLVDMVVITNPTGIPVDANHPLPVSLGNTTVQITSNNVNVTVPNTISVNSSVDNPVHVHITQMGAVNLDDTATYLPIGGNVSIFQSTGQAISNTNPLPVTAIVSTNGGTETADFEWQVALGKINNSTQVNIFGYSNTISDSFCTVWENSPSDYVFLPNAQILSVNSTSALDSTANVLITGLDTNWDPISEVVTLNGVSGKNTTNSFLRINSMALTRPGASQNTNVGHIYARYDGINAAIIDPGVSRSQMTVYSVANGYSLYVQNINMFSGDAAGASKFMNFRVDVYNSITNVNYLLLRTTWQNAYQLPRSNPFKYGQKQDIRWQMATNSGTYSGSGVIEAILIKD